MRMVMLCVLSDILLACGSVAPRHSTEERDIAHAAVERSGPFHSLLGWADNVAFYVDDSASDDVIEASIKAAASWNEGIGREVLVFAGVARVPRGSDLYSSLDDSITMIYSEKNWTSTTGKSDTTLATTIWENAADSDRIVKGDIIINVETYVFIDALASGLASSSVLQVVDAETVLLHEFGHLLGLDHVEIDVDPESVMHAKTFIGPHIGFRTLSAGDLEHAHTLYQ